MEKPKPWSEIEKELAKKFFDKYISRENIRLAWRE